MANKPKSLIEELTRGFWWILAVCGLFAVGVIYMELRFDDRLRHRVPDAAATLDHDVEPDALVSGQRQAAYVPAYSHVYHQDGRPLLLTVTLIVRNTDRDHDIALTSVRYYDSHGTEVRSHLEKPLRLKPLATAEFLIERDDTSGGSSPSFIVEWVADPKATQPVIETVMIDTQRQQGIAFARRGLVLAKQSRDSRSEATLSKHREPPTEEVR